MSNHGYVKAGDDMTPDKVHEVLVDLCESHFTGVTIDREEKAWGDLATWFLTWEHTQDDVSRICWMDKNGEFNIQHGGGVHYEWWMDECIRHEVARRFNGVLTDDAWGEEKPLDPVPLRTWKEYLCQNPDPYSGTELESKP